MYVTGNSAGKGWSVYTTIKYIQTVSVSVKDKEAKNQTTYHLSKNYPNPFNPETTLRYAIAKDNYVTLKIYNLLGKEIETLVNKQHSAGKYDVQWVPVGLPSGVYFYRLDSGTNRLQKTMVLLK